MRFTKCVFCRVFAQMNKIKKTILTKNTPIFNVIIVEILYSKNVTEKWHCNSAITEMSDRGFFVESLVKCDNLKKKYSLIHSTFSLSGDGIIQQVSIHTENVNSSVA